MQAIRVERLRDLDAEELTHAHTRHGAGEPGENPSIRQRVVGRPAPLAIGRSRGEALFHQQVIEQFFLGHALEMRQPRPVPQDVTHSDVFLAAGAEFGPVLRDGLVIGQQAAIHQAVDDHRRDPLGRGEHHRPRIGGPWVLTGSVGPSRPHVDNGSAVDVDRQRATAEPVARE